MINLFSIPFLASLEPLIVKMDFKFPNFMTRGKIVHVLFPWIQTRDE